MEGQFGGKRVGGRDGVVGIVTDTVAVLASLSVAYIAWWHLGDLSGLLHWAYQIVMLVAIAFAVLNGAGLATKLQTRYG